ncbi:MAG TPA: SDR family oxidoreductase [Trebonia sp.]|nr:SDR family oxidoreductase [Trebonia sp.]
MATDLAGRTALITGAGRGIGRAVALGFADAGAHVILLARTAGQLEETRAHLRKRGVPAQRIRVVPADLAEEDQRGHAMAAVLAAGRVDILVNNAGTVEPLGPTVAIKAEDLRLAFEVNVVAPAALTAAVLPGMLRDGWGRVVNVSSGIAANPAGMVRGNAYATTKAALEAHTVNLAAELRGTGVTVNAYRPGGVDTAMQAWIRRQDPRASAPPCTSGSTGTTPEAPSSPRSTPPPCYWPAWPAMTPGLSGTSAPPRLVRDPRPAWVRFAG